MGGGEKINSAAKEINSSAKGLPNMLSYKAKDDSIS